MKKIVPLTLLQRGVLQRMRAAGAVLGAEEAKAYWSDGRPCPREALTGLDEPFHRELFADFEKCNQQAFNTENT